MPENGSGNFSSQPSPVDSTVFFQCNPGLFPDNVRIATCQDNGEWDTDLSQLICRTRPGETSCLGHNNHVKQTFICTFFYFGMKFMCMVLWPLNYHVLVSILLYILL